MAWLLWTTAAVQKDNSLCSIRDGLVPGVWSPHMAQGHLERKPESLQKKKPLGLVLHTIVGPVKVFKTWKEASKTTHKTQVYKQKVTAF